MLDFNPLDSNVLEASNHASNALLPNPTQNSQLVVAALLPQSSTQKLLVANTSYQAESSAEQLAAKSQLISAAAVSSSPTGADLLISQATIPTTAQAGSSITVGYTEFNQGGSLANGHYVDFYLSTDNVFSTNDTLLGFNYLSSLVAGSSSSGSKVLSLNSNLAPGTYHLFVKADGINQVAESNEANNLFSQAITINSSGTPRPDLVINSATIPTAATIGNTINISYSEKNSGTSSAAYHTLGFYLSTDNVFSNNDTLLGQNTVTSLGVGQTNSGIKPLTLSNSLTPGNYYLFIKADSENQIAELNESNNLFSQLITLNAPPPPRADLSMRSITTFSGAMAGGILRINYEEINQGSGAAGTHAVNIYLSSDNQLNSSDLLLGSSTVNSLAVGASTGSVYAELPLSSSLTPGNYYVIFKADGNEGITESNETNNLMKQLITINPPLPDLQINSINNLTFANNLISFNYTETNNGIASAGQHTTQFYVSTDQYISSDDILIGDSPSPVLAPGATYSSFKNFTVNSIQPGNYNLIAKADGLNEVVEINEGNNVRTAFFTVSPPPRADLSLRSITTFSGAMVGGSLRINYEEINQGTANADTHAVNVYLSTDDALNSSDILIGSSTVNSLAVGASTGSVYAELPLSSSLTPGDYYVIFKADGNEVITETNETNNLMKQLITINPPLPDLQINSISNPTFANNLISFDYTETNNGIGSAGQHTTQFYVSTDQYISSDDILIGDSPSPVLAPGATYSNFKNFTVNPNLQPGNYYLISKADGLNEVAEINEGNNVKSAFFTVNAPLPDLQISQISNLTFANNLISFNYAETNNGIASAGQRTTLFYVSTDYSLSSDDILIGDSPSPVLAPGATYSNFKNFTVNPNLQPGTYYLIAKADGLNEVVEINEGNNISIASFNVFKPDLKIESATIPSSVSAGASLKITYHEKNKGNTAASSHFTRFYLSSDDTISSDDLLLGEIFRSSLGGGYGSTDHQSLTLDSSLAPGNYYVIIQMDGREQVTESDETNNLYTRMLTVTSFTPSQIDLAIADVTTFPIGPVVGSLTLNYAVRNLGSNSAGSHLVNFYLSTDSTLSKEDTYLGSNVVKSVDPYSKIYDSKQLFFEGNPLGTQFLILEVDSKNEIAEIDELNNLYALPIFFS